MRYNTVKEELNEMTFSPPESIGTNALKSCKTSFITLNSPSLMLTVILHMEGFHLWHYPYDAQCYNAITKLDD